MSWALGPCDFDATYDSMNFENHDPNAKISSEWPVNILKFVPERDFYFAKKVNKYDEKLSHANIMPITGLTKY